MARYEKWLGAGLGWVVGGPIGGIIGFITGSLVERGQNTDARNITANITEFEVNLIVLASHLIKADGRVSLKEIAFTEDFLNTHFDDAYTQERKQLLSHCLQKEYDLGIVCDQIRMNTQYPTRVQVIRFLLDLAQCDGELSERENYFIFRIAGYINVNDVQYRNIKKEPVITSITAYQILGVQSTATVAEIRTAYRRLVLQYHPDRNKTATEAEKKLLAQKFQQIQEAYDQLKG